MGDPIWMIAAANFTYLISICMPNIAAWLLRRDLPDAHRPYRAPRGTIMLGVFAACVWLLSAILGFQQFGLPTVLFGLALAYSGAALYAWRVMEDRHRQGLPLLAKTLHLKLTGAMLFVLVLDGIAYLMAVNTVPAGHAELVAVLEDIFVVVALLTISVGLVLPGMITYSAQEVSAAAKRLTWGTLRDFSLAMRALGRGDLDAAHASVNIVPVKPNSRDELGEMADSFNMLQEQVRDAAFSLDEARENMRTARAELLAAPRTDRPPRPSRPADRPSQPHLAGRQARRGVRARQAARTKTSRCSPSTSTTSRKPTTCSGTRQAMSCYAPWRDGSSLPPTATSSPASAATSSRSFAPRPTSRAPPRRWPAACCRPSPIHSRCRSQLIPIGLSIGAAPSIRMTAPTPITLLANADAALYRAKENGRKTVRFFDPDIDRRLRDRFALQIDLRSAINRNELLLHYQPQAKIDGEVFGFEALARWQHPIARAGAADRVHRPCRAERHDRRDRRLGVEGGLPRGGVMAGAAAGRRQPSPGAIPLWRPRRPRASRPARDGPVAWTAGAGDHRGRHLRRSVARAVDPCAASRCSASRSPWTTSAPAMHRCRRCSRSPSTRSRSTAASSPASRPIRSRPPSCARSSAWAKR